LLNIARFDKPSCFIFSPANPKYRVTVFTDIDCGYCRKLHAQIADYNKAGISIEYLFFPRAGVGSESFDKAVSVWCASDRRKALTDAKLDKPVASKTCTNPVRMDYDLGQRIGVDGTPAVYMTDGSYIGGYLSVQDMLARLERKPKAAK
jgi:thiol:disulfide interchange protein DsbC